MSGVGGSRARHRLEGAEVGAAQIELTVEEARHAQYLPIALARGTDDELRGVPLAEDIRSAHQFAYPPHAHADIAREVFVGRQHSQPFLTGRFEVYGNPVG